MYVSHYYWVILSLRSFFSLQFLRTNRIDLNIVKIIINILLSNIKVRKKITKRHKAK